MVSTETSSPHSFLGWSRLVTKLKSKEGSRGEWRLTPFQNVFLLCAKVPSNTVLTGHRLRSAAFLTAVLDFRSPITIWHSTIIAYFRSHFPECANRIKGSQIFPKASGQCQLKQIIWDLIECQITGCFSTERINKQL